MLESRVKSQVLDILAKREEAGGLWYSVIYNGAIFDPRIMKFHKKNKHQKNGISDVLVFYNNRTIWIELKSTTGKIKGSQEMFKDMIKRYSNGEFYKVDKVEDLKGILV